MKQPRHHTLKFQFDPSIKPTGFRIGADRSLQFEDENGQISPKSATWHFAYDRKNKPQPKELGRLPLNPTEIHFETWMALKQFDSLLAVDTNTKLIRGEKVSVGCVVQAELDYDNLPHIRGSFRPTACLEIRNARFSPERILWEFVLVGVERSVSYESINSLGLFVDSELGALSELNDRKESIRGTFFVPSRCQLLYASADRGTEWIGYHMIRTCDRVASCALKAIEVDATLDASLNTSTGNVYERYRPWDVNLSKHNDTVSITVRPSDTVPPSWKRA